MMDPDQRIGTLLSIQRAREQFLLVNACNRYTWLLRVDVIISLANWSDYVECGIEPVYNVHYVKSAPLDERPLFSFLQEKYEPVFAKWTTERCAICRWDEDYDVNKIIVCNMFQIAVHQECYAVRDVHDFISWVCRACEAPEIEKECCLCPVKVLFVH
ncbi:hypothetical protein L1887_14405 [Cichorium endivia]|nr:hypothetical protein L1887_14405 [Cichorium endivia]